MALGKFPHEIDEMPSSDFQAMFIAEQVAPFGDRRGDIQAGIIATTLANVFKAYVAGMAKKSYTPVDINDFMLPLMPKKLEQGKSDVEKQLEMMMAIQAIQNATVEASNG